MPASRSWLIGVVIYAADLTLGIDVEKTVAYCCEGAKYKRYNGDRVPSEPIA